LRKLGLNRSYVLVNAFPYAVHPSASSRARPLLADHDHLTWRNHLYNAISGPDLQAIVAFGANAQAALQLWDRPAGVPIFQIPHPSDHDTADLLLQWRTELPNIRAVVPPDPGGDATEPNYGTEFSESDYAPIPRGDLPFGLPTWVGDDSWGRLATPKHNNSVERPSTDPDPDHTLVWRAPVGTDDTV
jgi:hypothetical protein